MAITARLGGRPPGGGGGGEGGGAEGGGGGGEVYKQNAKAHAVFQSHWPHTIALTMSGKDFIPDDFEGKLYFPTVPVHTIKFDDYSAESPRLVASTLSKYCITVVSGHGVYACAESINLAYKWTCSLEHSAKIAFLNQQLKT